MPGTGAFTVPPALNVAAEVPTELPAELADLTVAAGGTPAGSSLSPGQAFGSRYRITRLLGAGGMGAVYEAFDGELGVPVALKVIRPEAMADHHAAAALGQRFKRELLLARQVTHKNVVRIHDLGEIDGVKYITMSFVEGETLAARLSARGTLPVGEALAIARQIASGLQAAHEAGVVHRDLKPANVMLDRDGHALIMDFGIARAETGPQPGVSGGRVSLQNETTVVASDETAIGTIVGTAEYMAPEQAQGLPVDHRADIYAFGLMVRDMLLGRRDSGGYLLALVDRVEKGLPPLRSVNPTLPEALEKIVSRCTQAKPEARYDTAADICAELARLDAEGNPLPEPRRLTWRVVAAAVVLVAGLTGGLAWLVRPRTPPPPPDPVSVLIADFENKSGEPVFEGSLEQTLAIGVEGASFITAYPHADAERVLARTTPGAKLDEAGARLVARREGIRVVLAGSIERIGSRYNIGVRVLQAAADTQAATLQATAANKADVLSAVGTLAGRVRTALGDTARGADLAAAAETFTAGSLEAVHEYALGQDLLLKRKHDEAIPHFRQAVTYDPQFGRAHAGWAVAAFTVGRTEEATEHWNKALSLMDRMTDREKFRTLGTYYAALTHDFEKAIETFEQLIKLYPADTAGHNNLAYAYFFTRNFPKALEEGRRAMELVPGSLLYRSNYALYAMYAGDFANAAKVAQQIVKDEPGSYTAYVPLAVAEVGAGNLDAARSAYERMAATGPEGASGATTGLADLALYQGRPADARAILVKSIPDDTRENRTAELIAKHYVMAEAFLQEGNRSAARTSASQARALGSSEDALVPAVHLALATEKEAAAASEVLGKQVAALSRAYGKIVDGEVALGQGKTVVAIDAFRAAIKFADLWLARYDMGVAYVQAGLFAEGLSELEACQKRRGEATALFFDDRPTVRYLTPLFYWLGRAKAGLKMNAAAADDYKVFLSLRPEGTKDPLALDARKRPNTP